MTQPYLLFSLKKLSWFVPLAILLCYALYLYTDAPLGDFANYYFGAYFQLKGTLGAWLYDPALFNPEVAKHGFIGIYGSYAPNPPFLALFYLPAAFFQPYLAKTVINILGAVLFVIFVYRWFHLFSIDKWWALFIPILFYKPILSNIYQGQPYFLILILLMEGYIFFSRATYTFSTLLWTTAIFLKIFPIIICLYLLLSRNFKALLWLMGCGLLLFLVCISVQGKEVWITFLSEILPKASNGEVTDNFAISYQSWNVGLNYLFVEDELVNANPWIPDQRGYAIGLLLIKAFIFSVTTRFVIRNKDIFSSFALIVVCGLLLTPTGTVYALILWMVFFLYVTSSTQNSYLVAVQLFLLAMACNIPFHTFSGIPFIFKFTRLLLLTALWISCFTRQDFSWKTYGAYLLVLLPLHARYFMYTPQNDPSKYLLSTNIFGILTGFGIENNKLVYTYWNEQGQGKSITDIVINTIDSQSVSIKNNVLYHHNVVLLDSPDKKKNPMLIDNHMVIYMSDKNHGPGFYTLRMVTIP